MEIVAFILRRLIYFIPVVLITTIIAFALTNVLPGNIADIVLGEHATEERVRELERELGLDKPLAARYFTWLGGIIQGDFGNSLYRRTPVMEMILPRLPITLQLVFFAKALSLLVGIALGTLSVLRPNSLVDFSARFVSLLGTSIPNFFLAVLLLTLFSVKLQLLPMYGFVSIFDNPVGAVKYLILPVFVTGWSGLAQITRQLRSNLLGIIGQDYMRTAFAKGLSKREVIMKHGLKNAFIPVITVFGTSIITAMGGSVIIENVFSIPGIGQLAVAAIGTRDFTLLNGLIIVNVVVVLIVNLIIDIVYRILDPRIRYSVGKQLK